MQLAVASSHSQSTRPKSSQVEDIQCLEAFSHSTPFDNDRGHTL